MERVEVEQDLKKVYSRGMKPVYGGIPPDKIVNFENLNSNNPLGTNKIVHFENSNSNNPLGTNKSQFNV